jgi:nitroimidazol reductase NimA-like FMN-containing flavoprotein (pyridoxamine 5'-phosphate oxidase superfamily)
VRRYPERGRSDRTELYELLDAGLIGFLGTVTNGHPRVLPMVYGRIGDTLYIHGAVKNQALVAVGEGAEVCVTVTNVYGLVLANSMFHHSLNFRSAMIYATPRVVTEPDERLAGLRAAVNQLVPGRGDELPDPTPKQLAQTTVIAISLEEASVKVRSGPPGGDPEDYETDIWGGVLPLVQTWNPVETDPRLRDGIDPPAHVLRLVGQPAYERAQGRPDLSDPR